MEVDTSSAQEGVVNVWAGMSHLVCHTSRHTRLLGHRLAGAESHLALLFSMEFDPTHAFEWSIEIIGSLRTYLITQPAI